MLDNLNYQIYWERVFRKKERRRWVLYIYYIFDTEKLKKRKKATNLQ